MEYIDHTEHIMKHIDFTVKLHSLLIHVLCVWGIKENGWAFPAIEHHAPRQVELKGMTSVYWKYGVMEQGGRAIPVHVVDAE